MAGVCPDLTAVNMGTWRCSNGTIFSSSCPPEVLFSENFTASLGSTVVKMKDPSCAKRLFKKKVLIISRREDVFDHSRFANHFPFDPRFTWMSRGMELWRMCWWLTLVWSTRTCLEEKMGSENPTVRRMPLKTVKCYGVVSTFLVQVRLQLKSTSQALIEEARLYLQVIFRFSWTYFFTQNENHDFPIESERQIDKFNSKHPQWNPIGSCNRWCLNFKIQIIIWMLSGTLLRVWICLIMRFLEIDFFKLGFLFNIPSNQKNAQSFLEINLPSRSGGGQAGIVSRLRPFGKPGGRWTAEGSTCSGMHWMLLKSQVNGLKEESYQYIYIYLYYIYIIFIYTYIYIYIIYLYMRIYFVYIYIHV